MTEPTELDQLRILAETAAHLRAAPESRGARRRRDESVRWAAGSHSLQVVATAAGLSAEAVEEILGPRSATSESPAAAPSGGRRRTKPLLSARFRPVR
ncbi:MAG: hypothetical protein ACOYD4_12250 [Solirubrobacterales bacterium]